MKQLMRRSDAVSLRHFGLWLGLGWFGVLEQQDEQLGGPGQPTERLGAFLEGTGRAEAAILDGTADDGA